MNPRTEKNGTILVVDDAPSTIDAVRSALEDAGYQVSVATSGEKALRRLEFFTPDLILLDILMPEMDGYDVCRRLKAMESTRDVPIIFLSALMETLDKVKAFEVGAVDYLIKPIAPEEMMARVRTQIAINRLRQELSAANRSLEVRVAERTFELRRANAALRSEIAERNRVEQDRIHLVEQLKAAVAARNEFLAIAAHELRTPLTPLVLQIQKFKKLLARTDLSTISLAVVDEFVMKLERQVTRLANLVEHLLDSSRLSSGKLKLELADTDLREVIRDAIDRAAAEIASSGSPIDLDLPEPIVGRWDRLGLEQVVTNLLTNALKYGMSRPITIAAKRAGRCALLIVADRGVGIRNEDKARIFQPFVRAIPYNSISGFGMGLYIVRQVVDALGAVIRVDSEPGKGCTITVELPLSGPLTQDA